MYSNQIRDTKRQRKSLAILVETDRDFRELDY